MEQVEKAPGPESLARAAAPLVLGPAGFDKIAIVGSAPSSVQLGPWGDKTWAVWGCSPGAYGMVPPGRADAWFEVHRWEPAAIGDPRNPGNKPWFSPEYVRFLELFEGPVYMAQGVDSVKNCVVYPFAEMLAEFGPYVWTSTMAYMLALAIKLKPRAIGLWGVDMAASSEYAFQRPACQHFMGLAAALGIQIVVPPESDLLQPPAPYGFIELHPRHAKLLRRREELMSQLTMHQSGIKSSEERVNVLKGCIDNLDYILTTWTGDVDEGLRYSDAVSHAAVLAGRPVPIVAAAHRFKESQIPPPLELHPPLIPADQSEWEAQRHSQEQLEAEYRRGVADGSSTMKKALLEGAAKQADPPRTEGAWKGVSALARERKISRKRAWRLWNKGVRPRAAGAKP